MAQEKRRKEARKAQPEPFLTLPAVALLSAALRCDGLMLKLWLLLHAAWTPTAHQGRPGAIVPFETAVTGTGAGRSQVAMAFRLLRLSGLAWVIEEGTRPAGPGGARGLAKVWGLPFRVIGQKPSSDLLMPPPGVGRPEGKVRWNAGRVRQDARVLSHHAFRLLVAALAHGDRDRYGGLVRSEPFDVAALARLSHDFAPRTASRALRELINEHRLIVAQPASGRRPMLVQLAQPYRTFERRGPRSASTPLPPHGIFKKSR